MNLLASTILTNTSNTSTIAGSVTLALAVILLAILGFIFWRKKRRFVFNDCLFGREQMNLPKETCKEEKLIDRELDIAALEEITPHEVDADTGFISNCQNYL